ncbi:tyrosine-type recombinase/integrase [Burkholderia ubonensis]|uniref:tyrosine-type recombinase/integrase n=1 Tax=Burkholderia ubonensis TaxID=101571 RepID=UPI0012FB5054|nr:site-specific integrase [Burkholderia ubonensis]
MTTTFDGQNEYDDACKLVQKWADELSVGVSTNAQTMTVGDVCRLYVTHLKTEKGEKSSYDADKRFERYVYPDTAPVARGAPMPGTGNKKRVEAFVYPNPIGAILLSALKPIDVWKWRNALLDRSDPDDEESYSKAKDSINRNLKSLKAALNFGKNTLKLVSTDIGWKGVKMYPKVGARRDGWLTPQQRNTLLAAMPDDLRTLAIALLLTGARPGEIASANASDFDKSAGTLALDGKTGKRIIPLSTKAREFFGAQVTDRIGNAPLLVRADNERWTAPAWGRMFREVREKAKLPDAVLYSMRHTYISESISQGMNVYEVATLTGTSVDIIQRHYGKLTPETVERLNRVALL